MAVENAGYAAERKLAVGDRFRLWDLVLPLAIAAAPAFGLAFLLPPQIVAPALSLLSLVMACALALSAAITKSDRQAYRAAMQNLSCAFAFVWIVTARMSHPQQVIDWFDHLSTTLR
jgi:hypothetical protein